MQDLACAQEGTMPGLITRLIRSKMRAAKRETGEVLRRLPDLQAEAPRLPLPYL
jgi:hypothetical protein